MAATRSKRLRDVETTLSNLTETAAKGGAVPAVLEALNRADAERRALMVELARPTAVGFSPGSDVDPSSLRRKLRAYVDDWHGLLQGDVVQRRKLFDLVLRDRIRFRPVERKDGPGYELTVPGHGSAVRCGGWRKARKGVALPTQAVV